MNPHASWAEVYDLAYRHSFGNFYDRLTDLTLDVIADRVTPPASILDFGAGTGRLSIPLARRGYRVTAVEPCLEMLEQLGQKSGAGQVRVVNATMAAFTDTEKYDLALCVFTVILYLLDEEALTQSIKAARAALKPGGLMLIDIPSDQLFQSFSVRNEQVERTVEINRQDGDVFRYRENIVTRFPGQLPMKFTDDFQIRCWPREVIVAMCRSQGLEVDEDLSADFRGTGSDYLVMKKGEAAGMTAR